MAVWSVELLPVVAPQSLAQFGAIEIDATVLAFTLGASLLTGLVFGVVPSIQVSRADLYDALKDGGRGSTRGRQMTRRALVIAEIALALVLLVGAGFLLPSFQRVPGAAPGFNPPLTTAFLPAPQALPRPLRPGCIRAKRGRTAPRHRPGKDPRRGPKPWPLAWACPPAPGLSPPS